MAKSYLDKIGLGQLWSLIKSKFVQKSGDTMNGALDIQNQLSANSAVLGNLNVTGDAVFSNGLRGDLTGNASTATKATQDSDGNIIKDTYAVKEQGVEFIVGTQSAATGSWTGVTTSASLYNGKRISYFLPYSGSGNATLNLTLSNGTTTGAIPVYRWGTTYVTTHYPANSVLPLTYVLSKNAWFYDADYDSNDPNYRHRVYYSTTYKTKAALYRYQLLFSVSDTELVPVNSVDNSVATNKTLTTESFDPFKPIYYFYYTSTSYSAGASIGANGVLYDSWEAIDLRYSFNTGTTLTANKSVYIVAVPQGDGKVKLHTTPIAQEISSTDNGLVYIYLGRSIDTYRVELYSQHPVYQYKNGRIQSYTGELDDNYWIYNSSTDSIDLVFPS